MGVSLEVVEALLAKLPREEDEPEYVTKRVRFETIDGRVVFAFLRAGGLSTGFAGCEAKPGMTQAPEMELFLVGAEHPEDPLQVVSTKGPVGVIELAEMEDRPS
jgi:hypothetical protein